jgi:CRISPR-associated protein Csb2
MTVTIDVRYIAGRVHGTPWGISHNEGAVEFPPSPWRILRALIATWYERVPDIPESVVRELIEVLAKCSPTYEVPRFANAHARHYFPDSAHKKGVATATAKVIDAFAAVDPDSPLRIHWDVDLGNAQLDALSRLVQALPHLGRAESLVDAAVREEPSPPASHDYRQVRVHQVGATQTLRLLSPTAASTWEELLGVPWKLRQKGFVRPPGSVLASYGCDAPLVWQRTQRNPAKRPVPIQMVMWRLKGQGRIPLTSAVGYADLLRSAVQSQFGNSDVPWQISGHSEDGRPLLTQHTHGFVLPIVDFEIGVNEAPSEGSSDRFLRGLAYYFPEGLPSEYEKYLTAPQHLFTRTEGHRDLRSVSLFLQSFGPKDLSQPAFGQSKVWRTVTPYAPSRHIRSDARMMRSLMAEINRDLAEKGHPTALSVNFSDDHHYRALAFRRHRVAESLREGRRAFHLQLEFNEEVSGPISLGALAHFGLGHFVPSSPILRPNSFTTGGM